MYIHTYVCIYVVPPLTIRTPFSSVANPWKLRPQRCFWAMTTQANLLKQRVGRHAPMAARPRGTSHATVTRRTPPPWSGATTSNPSVQWHSGLPTEGTSTRKRFGSGVESPPLPTDTAASEATGRTRPRRPHSRRILSACLPPRPRPGGGGAGHVVPNHVFS